MTEGGRLMYKDYYTPSTADLLVRRFQCWLDAAAQATARSDDLSASDIDEVHSAKAFESDQQSVLNAI